MIPTPTLAALVKAASKVKMTPDQVRKQRISFIRGQTGLSEYRIREALDRQ